jgi:hypothetical protein
MTAIKHGISRWLCTAPLLYAGLFGGQTLGTEGSCVAAAFDESTAAYVTEHGVDPSVLVRGYQLIAEKELYSMRVAERLWEYFLNEAEYFSPEQVEVIDREFWNLG